MPALPARIVHLEKIQEDVLTMSLDFEPPGSFVFEPGQWVSVRAELEGKKITRAYSLLHPSQLTLCLDRVPGGVMSNHLFACQVGDVLELTGPHGNFILPESLPKELVLIARFTGIVPVFCILEKLLPANPACQVTLIYGAADGRRPLDASISDWTARYENFTYHKVAEGAECETLFAGFGGRTDYFPMFSGGSSLTTPVRAFLKEQGFERGTFRQEKFY